MRTFATYFTFEKILFVLINKRLSFTPVRHDANFLGKLSTGRKKSVPKSDAIKEHLHQIFPPRDQWLTIDKKKRNKVKNGNHEIAFKQLYVTVMKNRALAKQSGIEPHWLKRLNKLVAHIKLALKNPASITLIPTGYVYIPKKPGKPDVRAIVNYKLRDAVVISLVNNYLTDHSDIGMMNPYFSDDSFAFRSSRLQQVHGKTLTYHTAVRKIELFRQANVKDGIYVAEVDLQKFYDCLNHKVINQCLDKFYEAFSKGGAPVDERAKVVMSNYLSGFCFNKNLLKYEISGKREFKWPVAELKSMGVDIKNERIGVPQGGALSCFLANLLLHELDYVFNVGDDSLNYLRFCDDFIVLHKDKAMCQKYVDLALEQLEKIKLVVHSPNKFNLTDYKKRVRTGGTKEVNEFWNVSKSKNPYFWGRYGSNNKANVPYVAFVGYQIRYDGLIRVRKKSVHSEFLKQKKLVSDIIHHLTEGREIKIKKRVGQILFRTEQKMIAMSVGKINPGNTNEQLGFCWANGFKEMNNHPLKLNAQLKRLDRSRENQLWRLHAELLKLPKEKFPPMVITEEIEKLPGATTSYYRYFNKFDQPKTES